MPSLPEDTTGPQRSTQTIRGTRTLTGTPRRSRPIVAYIRNRPEPDRSGGQGPEVTGAGRQDSSRERVRERAPSSDFDFPSELPLLNLSSAWQRQESRRGTQHGRDDDGTNRDESGTTSSSSSSLEAPSALQGKLQGHNRDSAATGIVREEVGQVQSSLASKPAVDVMTSVQPNAPAQPPPANTSDAGRTAQQEGTRPTYKRALAASSPRRVSYGQRSVEPLAPSTLGRRVHSHHATFTSARAFRASSSQGKRHAVGNRTPVPPPLPAPSPSSSSESVLKFASSRERRRALSPTRDQLRNLYNTLMVQEHPPKREGLSRAAFRKKFFLPKGIEMPLVPPPALHQRAIGSGTSMGAIRPPEKGALPRDTDQDDIVVSRVKRACLATVAVVVVTVTVVAFFHLFRVTSSLQPRQLVCVTDDCRLHALFLDYNINNTFSPCKDFDSHICSTWTPSQTYAELGATALGEVAVNWVGNFLPLLRRSAGMIKIAEKPLQMYEACMKERDDATAADGTLFMAFLKELNLVWPDRSGNGTNALGLLINMAFNWQMTFWLSFRVRMVSPRHGKCFIAAGDPDVLLLFAMNHRYVTQRDSYVEYWMSHYTALYGNTSAPHTAQITASAIEQTDIIAVLTDIRKKKRRLAMALPLDKIASLKGRITSSHWLEHLREYLPKEQFLPSGDQVIGDSVLLEAIGLLFNKYSDEQLVYHLSWQFIQLYFLVLERTPLQIVHWGKTYSSAYVPVYCTLYVEELYRPLLSAVHAKMAIAPSDTSRLNTALGGLVEKLVWTINSSQLDPGAKRAALAVYQSMEIQIWPPGKYFKDQEAEKAYSCYSEERDSFVQHWIESHRCLQRTVATAFHRETTGMHRLLSSSPVTYDPIGNELAVAASALAHPLYYPHGTPAMFYGGLGFLFVAEALKALDRDALAVLSNASAAALSNSTSASNTELGCFTVQENDTRATYFAALNIAYSAFVEDEANEVQERRRPISKTHSEESVFFLTVCRMMCQAPTLRQAGTVDCDTLFRRSPEFSSAFSCPSGSVMNPTKQCLHF
ncbi:endothelin-converting enzyme 1-like [Amblyomma americanum]